MFAARVRACLFHSKCLAMGAVSIACLTAESGVSGEGNVLAWARECARVVLFEVGWFTPQEILTETGDFYDSFDQTVAARYDYPDQMSISTRYIPTGHAQDASWAIMSDLDVNIDAAGNWTETSIRGGTTRDLGDRFRLRDLVRSQAVEAPILLGMWINEHPDRFEVMQVDAIGNVLFRAIEMNWQATLEDAADPRKAWVSRLEAIDSDGNVLAWYLFDDPVTIKGATVRTGSIRTPVSIQNQTTPREGLSANLEYARRVEPPVGNTESGTTAEPAASSIDSPPPASTQHSWIWWIGGVATVLGVAAGGVLWTRWAA